ncbi:hypothetical protein Tco_0403411 [Tanacetum coccineum]
MELENSQNNALAKLPMLKLGEYEMWEIRIKQYFQIQDYAFLPKLVSTTSFSDATVYAFLSTQPQGSQRVHEDLEQIHDDDLEEMDLKWNMALQETGIKEAIKAVRIGRCFRKAMLLKMEVDLDGVTCHRMKFQANMLSWHSRSELRLNLKKLRKKKKGLKSKRGFGYTAVPSPHPLILNRPTPLDLSYSGLEEFKHPEINEYGPRDSSLKPTTVCDRESII